jgi:hypothetical protein
MLRMQCDDCVWCMRVRGRKLELKALKDHAQRHLGFKQRKVLSDADPGPPAEWEEHRLVLGCLRDPLCEPLWLEFMCILPLNVCVVVNQNCQRRVVRYLE